MPVRRKHIRNLAQGLLARCEITAAPVPIEKIARCLGISVRHEPTDDDLSGFLYRDRKRRTAIIGVNSEHHRNRQRFTVGHEVGHFLLHDFDAVHIDRRFQVKLRNDESSKGTDLEEKEANLFAAEVLMPADLLKEDVVRIGTVDLDDERTIKELAEHYQVSTQALAFRLGYLGYVQL